MRTKSREDSRNVGQGVLKDCFQTLYLAAPNYCCHCLVQIAKGDHEHHAKSLLHDWPRG